jgi:hypothetical protein
MSVAVFAPCQILTLAVISKSSLKSVALCMLGFSAARALVATTLVARCLRLSFRDICEMCVPGFILSLCTFALSKLFFASLHHLLVSQIAVFCLVVALTAGSGTLLITVFARVFIPRLTIQWLSSWIQRSFLATMVATAASHPLVGTSPNRYSWSELR